MEKIRRLDLVYNIRKKWDYLHHTEIETSSNLSIATITLAPIVLPVLIPQFGEAVEIIQIMSLAIIPISINYMYISKFLGIEKSKIVLIAAGIYLLIQITGIFTLGGIYGVNGAAFSLVLATCSQSVYLVSAERITKNEYSFKDFK